MQQGKHQEYEKKLHEQLNVMGTVERKSNSSPQGTKQESWPLLNNGILFFLDLGAYRNYLRRFVGNGVQPNVFDRQENAK